jgi:spermidine synthase
VTITISEERGVRYLHLASPWIQGAMRISRPFALELEYTRDLMLPLLVRDDDWPRTVLQIGLGAASVTKFLYRYRPQSRITIVETLEDVVIAARTYFRLPEDPARLHLSMGDGRDFVERSRSRFDFIIVDGFDEMGRAGRLESLPFYSACRERLTTGGMLGVNLLTRSRGVKPSVERLKSAFGDQVVVIPPGEAGNTVAIAAVGKAARVSFEDLRSTARALKGDTGLNLLPALVRLAGASSAKGGLAL